jgi:hypothetical protein
MSKIFVGQTKLTIQLDVKADISDVTTAEIRFQKPSNQRGSFPAEVEDPENGIIKYVVEQPTDIDVPGRWRFWAYLTYSDGKVIPGEISEITVYSEGSP